MVLYSLDTASVQAEPVEALFAHPSTSSGRTERVNEFRNQELMHELADNLRIAALLQRSDDGIRIDGPKPQDHKTPCPFTSRQRHETGNLHLLPLNDPDHLGERSRARGNLDLNARPGLCSPHHLSDDTKDIGLSDHSDQPSLLDDRQRADPLLAHQAGDRKSTRLNSSHH